MWKLCIGDGLFKSIRKGKASLEVHVCGGIVFALLHPLTLTIIGWKMLKSRFVKWFMAICSITLIRI